MNSLATARAALQVVNLSESCNLQFHERYSSLFASIRQSSNLSVYFYPKIKAVILSGENGNSSANPLAVSESPSAPCSTTVNDD